MDTSFDSSISFTELGLYIKKLGLSSNTVLSDFNKEVEIVQFRDKSIEVIVKQLNKVNKNFIAYFSQFDEDHDMYLTQKEMKKALLAVPERRFSTM
jgi:hypothetical protein